ncbi:thioesterase domain-containing protein [Xenorhabdus bovienii]|uniref:thioesterase domain-containing protein n=1 Tax=Xenorhabdus bovienii TaxID=40576 RepID=UPI003DA4C0F9
MITQLKKGSNGNIFLIHPSGASAYFYRDFARCVTLDVNVFAIQSPAIRNDYVCLNDMQAVSELYMNCIKAKKSTGPYIIGGASSGGAIAHAIANRLIKCDDTVKLLFMIDTPTPKEKYEIEQKKEIEILAYLFGFQLDIEKINKRFYQEPLMQQIEYIQKSGTIPKARLFSSEKMIKIYNIWKDNVATLWGYSPNKFPNGLLYFSAKNKEELDTRQAPGYWNEFCHGELNLFEIEGTHSSINRLPNVKNIVVKLEQFLT